MTAKTTAVAGAAVSAQGPDLLTAVFDTNAIRSLGELEDDKWKAFLASWRAQKLTTAWVPWTISEVAGSNLARKNGLKRADLAEVVRAVQRFDKLARGRVLADSNEIVRRALYSLAGVPVPPSDRADQEQKHGRRVIDVAKRLASTDQVAIEDKNGCTSIVLKKKNLNTGVSIKFDYSDFEDGAKSRLEFWRKHTKCSHGAHVDERVREIIHFLPDFTKAAALAPSIDVPLDIASRAVMAGKHLLDSALGYRCIIESWYFHLRATGDKSSIEKNDIGDISIASYMALALRLVSDDRNLRKLLHDVLANPDQVIGLEDFVNRVCERP
jgi:hypothetical protein